VKRSVLSILLIGFLFSGPVAYAQDAKSDAAGQVEEAAKFSDRSLGPDMCVSGEASGFSCSNVNLVSFVSLNDLGAFGGVGLNDAWGWVDPETGRTYALVAREDGVAFVDLTVPESPVYVGELPQPNTAQINTWRDIKVDGHYAFIVADSSPSRLGMHGMQVFDLRKLRNHSGTPITFEQDAHFGEFLATHNIVINEETDRAYIVGSRYETRGCGPGLFIVDISDPLSPQYAGCFNDPATGRRGSGYTHDAQCVVYRGPDVQHVGNEICIGSNETAISVADVTDAEAPFVISSATYPTASYVHQGWLTEDHRYFVQNDEGDERIWSNQTRTFIWDMLDLDDPVLLTEFVSDVVSIDHNLYIRGDFVYQANYTSGLRIMDISDPSNPRIAGWFDTLPDADEVSFRGAWTAYPFPDSDLVIVTSRDEGLFVLRPSEIIATEIDAVSAEAVFEGIQVTWNMVRESNVESYKIESRNVDGTYELLSEAQVDGDSREGGSYQTIINVEQGVYRIRVSANNTDGGQVSSDDLVVSVISGTHLLNAPFPNPGHSTISSSLVVGSYQHVRASLVDVSGREVGVLFDGVLSPESVLPLNHDVSALVGGVYFLHVVGERFTDTEKFVVVR